MKFDIGKKLKFNDRTFKVLGLYQQYAFVQDVSTPVIEGGGEILMIKEQPGENILVMTNKDQIAKVLKEMFSNGKFNRDE